MVMGAFHSYHLLTVLIVILSYVSSTMSCLESERQALLMFKGGLIDEFNRLGSWVDVGGGSCCDWSGVSCNNSTGHVIGLHLQAPYDLSVEPLLRTELRGTISPSLLHLKRLVHLNLSWNDFGGTVIPPFLGLMTSLEQLDLSYAGFGGKIPSQIGNLTNLHYLRLGGKPIVYGDGTVVKIYEHSLYSDSLQWVSGLSLLRHLDLSSVNLSKAEDWLPSINTIPFLSELILGDCLFAHHHLPSISLPNNLSSLSVLDLSDNFFEQSSVPKWIFHLHNLNTLDLHRCYFQLGPIPEGLRNLSGLRKLDLSGNKFNSYIPDWFSHLSSGLQFLSLEANSLQGVISSSIGNLTSLTMLDLSVNVDLEIGGRETLKSIGHLCNLEYLGLSEMKVNQDVVDVFHDLSSSCPSNRLEELDLEFAGIFGNLTNVPFEKFKSLASLRLSSNSISGSIPPSFGELQSLESAFLDENSMAGAVSETHFAKLARLKYFWARGNKLDLKVSPSWIPPFQLIYLDLSSWQLGKEFPRWLHSQKNIEELHLSGCGIEGAIPKGCWNMSPQLEVLTLSNNQLRGEVPIFPSKLNSLGLSNNSFESISKGFWNFSGRLNYLNLSNNKIVEEIPNGHLMTFLENGVVDLSSNKFHGQLPPFSSNLAALDFSDNSFSGSLTHFLCYQMNQTKQMQVLNLGNNFFSGEIPNCWLPWRQLSGLKLNNNKFVGHIPNSVENLSFLESLHLRNNNLSGELPLLLRSCQMLSTVDLAENHFQGEIPSWINKTKVKILSLRSNKLHGKVPREICALTTLQILDLANNDLSGDVPECINNFTTMITGDLMGGESSVRDDYAILVIKGRVMEYTTTLNLVRILDFSNNFFTGKIPDEVTTLVALQSLNLSQNMLTEGIPQNIGAMRSLESLDLSVNKLCGEIPSSISSLSFLSHLNLSTNNLTGRIPSSTQLQSFDASCFAGNDLCGPPLAKSCDGTHTIPISRDKNGEATATYLDMEWFFVSMAFGFVFGFWAFLLPLFCNRQWRMAFFSFLDTVVTFICELVNLDM